MLVLSAGWTQGVSVSQQKTELKKEPMEKPIVPMSYSQPRGGFPELQVAEGNGQALQRALVLRQEPVFGA